MLLSLGSCKTGYPPTSITWPYRGLRYRPIEVEVFWSYPLTSYLFSNDRKLKLFFFKFIWNKLCLCAALLKFWFQTDLGRSSEAKIQPGVKGREDSCFWLFSTWLRVNGHALRLIQLCSHWSKFERRVHYLWITSLLFDLNNKFINGSFAFSPGYVYYSSKYKEMQRNLVTSLVALFIYFFFWTQNQIGTSYMTYPSQ